MKWGMSYQSPIELIQTQMRNQIEEEIYKAVINVGVNVDKAELIKALCYDRNQYQKGYADRDSEIIRCKYCEWYDENISFCNNCHLPREQTFFCADGKRRTDDD